MLCNISPQFLHSGSSRSSLLHNNTHHSPHLCSFNFTNRTSISREERIKGINNTPVFLTLSRHLKARKYLTGVNKGATMDSSFDLATIFLLLTFHSRMEAAFDKDYHKAEECARDGVNS